MADDEQKDELEALKAIFDEDFFEISAFPPCFMIRLTGLEVQLKGPVSIKVTFSENYPDEAPNIEIPIRKDILSTVQQTALLQQLRHTAEENVGNPVVFLLVDEAKVWLNEHVSEEGEDCELEEEAEADPVTINFVEPKVTGGKWNFVIGLVGKPSAGKSTFFNAATKMDLAKTGVHPFTTIDPNIGKAFYSIPCPCARLSKRCNAAHGHTSSGERHLPVLLKDVAGLVPGACDGKGRGNRFLNDLLDADVLIHIIDISGCTDEKGEQTVGYDPTLDVSWIQRELHRWIYDNVMEKWDAIKRRPLKLIDMFTGYHANQSVIYSAFQSCGIDSKHLSNLATWGEDVVHRIVTSFLKIRFPIYLVLNKSDLDTAEANIKRLQDKYPDIPSLPVSAKSECVLQELCKSGVVYYSPGDNSFSCLQHVTKEVQTQLDVIQQSVLQRYGSSNVHRALSEAVRLREPSYAFPVQDLDTLMSVDKYRGLEPGILRDCISLRPGTTVYALYNTLFHYPLHLAAGDFVRAECTDSEGRKRILKKEEIIEKNNNLLKIFTNRKVSPVKAKD